MTRRRLALPLLASATLALGVTACDTADGTTASAATTTEAAAVTSTAGDVWDATTVHTFEVDYDASDYQALMDAYASTGEKVWITATVTIDGVTYENAGLKLKGNSSLRSASADSDPADLPWIIRLDKYVDGQSHDGSTEFVVRGNSSETSLNEAVALDLLAATGLASQQAIAVAFTVEGGDPTLRLVIENPDDSWMQDQLGDGLLYKAEAGGDYSYRGDDAELYSGAFDQEGGADDLDPLIDLLEFINNADDATFAAELPDRLDVAAFATYLAFQEVVDNSDDIDGRGNNSYLYVEPDTGMATVVSWDLNLAFGASPGGGTMQGDRTMPANGGPGDGVAGPAGGGGGRGGAGGGSNVLAERFLANDDFAALVDAEITRLTTLFYADGLAEDVLDARAQTLLDGATGLVGAATIEDESAALAAHFAA